MKSFAMGAGRRKSKTGARFAPPVFALAP